MERERGKPLKDLQQFRMEFFCFYSLVCVFVCAGIRLKFMSKSHICKRRWYEKKCAKIHKTKAFANGTNQVNCSDEITMKKKTREKRAAPETNRWSGKRERKAKTCKINKNVPIDGVRMTPVCLQTNWMYICTMSDLWTRAKNGWMALCSKRWRWFLTQLNACLYVRW